MSAAPTGVADATPTPPPRRCNQPRVRWRASRAAPSMPTPDGVRPARGM
jgi:hypothetical protein